MVRSRAVRSMGALLAVGASACATSAQTAFISEIVSNPPGTDNGFEGVEITGTPGMSLNGWMFIMIEGDSTGAGIVDAVIPLDGKTIGENGVFFIRDASRMLLPRPDSRSTLWVQDFDPDIENGTITFVLATGAFVAPGDDLDTNNDGVIDVPLEGFVPVDAVAYSDGGPTDWQYAAYFGGVNLGNVSAHALYRILTTGNTPLGWAGGHLAGPATGPFTFAQAGSFGWDVGHITDASTRTVDLGTLNYAYIPGQCCMSDLTCFIASEAECRAQGGRFQGENTTCDAPCPIYGACCMHDYTCSVITIDACAAQDGIFQGTNTTCAAICPIVCPCDFDRSSTVNSQDFFDFLNAFFSGNADIDRSGSTSSQDFFMFMNCFFEGCAE